MRKHLKTLLVGLMLATGLSAAPALYAHDSADAGGSMMGRGVMGQGGMMGMMSSIMAGMMGMSGDRGDMAGTMGRCNEMMQDMDSGQGDRPNDQWRSPQPERRGQPQG